MLPDQQRYYCCAITPHGVSGLRQDEWALNPSGLWAKVEIIGAGGFEPLKFLILPLAIIRPFLSVFRLTRTAAKHLSKEP